MRPRSDARRRPGRDPQPDCRGRAAAGPPGLPGLIGPPARSDHPRNDLGRAGVGTSGIQRGTTADVVREVSTVSDMGEVQIVKPVLVRELIGETLREERALQGKTLREVS